MPADDLHAVSLLLRIRWADLRGLGFGWGGLCAVLQRSIDYHQQVAGWQWFPVRVDPPLPRVPGEDQVIVVELSGGWAFGPYATPTLHPGNVDRDLPPILRMASEAQWVARDGVRPPGAAFRQWPWKVFLPGAVADQLLPREPAVG